MIKTGIIGATGYAGAELARLIMQHPEAELTCCASRSYAGQRYAGIYKNCNSFTELDCEEENIAEMAKRTDVIFTATPQGYLASVINRDILADAKIIDLSADFRFKDAAVYEKWYGIEHKCPELFDEAVYGLCEINREQIKKTRLLANPGCYTTCSILSLYPLVKAGLIDHRTIIVDAKSGTSGAGRGAKTANLFCEVNENIKAYGVTNHRHTPEIEEQLSYAAGEPVMINFTPHLVPMMRGILVTAYASLTDGSGSEAVNAAYEEAYGEEPFIRLLKEGEPAETRWVEGSNYVDIGFKIDKRTGRIVVMAALDNLVKGAAGQAVQNMNLMFGLDETAGLMQLPMFP